MVTQNMLRTHEVKQVKKIRFVTALVLIKCLKQIKMQRLLLPCAPISELQFIILYVQEVVTLLYSNFIHKMGHYFLDTQ